ncbi:class I SAM-dependent methyltransferase [Nocardioides sp. R-C-SC26]|uniref:class I SAM-dependent methyltransferase n=1 Tax=Nocardioides sp. R-C-SC26 TaxID=2870414 RepID=UPI001E5CAF11|nr:class I SAM-dependent methyltransferase [Nocardioides sp. R-C-SC26]
MALIDSRRNESDRGSLTIGDAVETLLRDGLRLRFEAYDGSAAGPADSEVTLELLNQRGLAYLLTAPGDLGLARAYAAGDLVIHGEHPGNPYAVMQRLKDHTKFRAPTAGELLAIVRGLGLSSLKPPPPPPQEHLPRWRRVMEGVRHSMTRDAEAIHHHYDVSNAFYRHVLGPSMAYTCAVYPSEHASLEEAQYEKFDLVARKLDLRPGMRLLDVGCGWGGMVRHAAREYGVHALGVTLSAQQASWAQEAIDRDGLGDLAEVRHLDYREVGEGDFDAVSSIGLTEHIGVQNYPGYFGFLHSRLRPEGRLLNHCITRHHNRPTPAGAFIDRYVFPDGELTGSGTIITEAEDAGFEVMHTENLRLHYARTLAAWNQNLVDHWDACVAEVGEGTARVWGLYMAACRIGFERNEVQLAQVLGVKVGPDGSDGFPLRPTW